jgi:hypothetical protein
MYIYIATNHFNKQGGNEKKVGSVGVFPRGLKKPTLLP